jgi:invasion protein IalB
VIVPLVGAEIFVNADLARKPMAASVIRDDKRKVADLRDHGIIPVCRALAMVARMDVDVGDHGHFQVAALSPDHAELAAVEFDDAVVEAVRINVVVKEELPDSPGSPVSVAKQERAAFAPSAGAAMQLINAGIPDLRVADQPS